MEKNQFVFNSPEALAEEFAGILMSWVEYHSGDVFHLAISGGSTPNLLFSVLAEKYPDSPLWQKVHFWWVDERMVPPDDSQSNYGNAFTLLLSHISVPEENVHRIKGENDPNSESKSYGSQINQQIKTQDGWPVFDLILLGLGSDGHTASIFPNRMELFQSDQICAVTSHPENGQKRITLTVKAINHASKICFLVTGQEKADVVSAIFARSTSALKYPAMYILPVHGELYWFSDLTAIVG